MLNMLFVCLIIYKQLIINQCFKLKLLLKPVENLNLFAM